MRSIDQSIIVQDAVVAVLIIDDAEDAVPTAEALAAGGVSSIELTLRTDAAIEAIRRIKERVPATTVGAGTVIFPEQVQAVVDAGADFAVAPGFLPSIAQAAVAAGLPYAPGVAVPSDIEGALSFGFRVLKFYPAEPMGGLSYLSAMTAPYAYLGLRFVPLGGVNTGNLESYLRSPLVSAVGGSWLAKRDLINSGDWRKITANAREASEVATRVREETS